MNSTPRPGILKSAFSVKTDIFEGYFIQQKLKFYRYFSVFSQKKLQSSNLDSLAVGCTTRMYVGVFIQCKMKNSQVQHFFICSRKSIFNVRHFGCGPQKFVYLWFECKRKTFFSHYHVRVNNCLCSEEFRLFLGSLVKSLI